MCPPKKGKTSEWVLMHQIGHDNHFRGVGEKLNVKMGLWWKLPLILQRKKKSQLPKLISTQIWLNYSAI